MPETRDVFTRMRRRGLLYGLFFWIYVPVHRRAQVTMGHPERINERLVIQLWCISAAAILSRFLAKCVSTISITNSRNFKKFKNTRGDTS